MDELPIIYVRGYAGPTSGIDTQVDDPFYGFNKGATHVRTGGDGDPMFYQFEGPLLRLITEHGYALQVHGDQRRLLSDPAVTIETKSIWVHRFYDEAATTSMPGRTRMCCAGWSIGRTITSRPTVSTSRRQPQIFTT